MITSNNKTRLYFLISVILVTVFNSCDEPKKKDVASDALSSHIDTTVSPAQDFFL